jgi:hypothetical protein
VPRLHTQWRVQPCREHASIRAVERCNSQWGFCSCVWRQSGHSPEHRVALVGCFLLIPFCLLCYALHPHCQWLSQYDVWSCSKDGSPDWNIPPTTMDRDKHNNKNLKKCVVGEGCKIHETAKLTNCIVMRNVSVMENAVLEASFVVCKRSMYACPFSHFFTPLQNCILCDYSVVRANCRLKKCCIFAIDVLSSQQ